MSFTDLDKGSCFKSYTDFQTALMKFCDDNFHPTRHRSSHKLHDEKADRFIYQDLLITCVHYGLPRDSKATTCRPHQTRLAIGCSMKIRVILKRTENNEDFCLQVL